MCLQVQAQQTKSSNKDVYELKMNFPGIHFKHQSTDYADMPYTVDSCFKYLATHLSEINSRPIWKDSSETEQLTRNRIQKLNKEFKNYARRGRIKIQSMADQQKIPQRTIRGATDTIQIQYLLSLNCVFEVSGLRNPNDTTIKSNKVALPCWLNLQLNKAGRQRCKMERHKQKHGN